MTMSTTKSCIDCKKYRNIIILSVLLLFGGTVEHLSEAKGGGCVIGSPKRRLSFVKPTCKLNPVHVIRGGDLLEEDDEFEDNNLDDPIGNEIISSFHIELQRIRTEMLAEAIREMDLLRDELLRKKQERKNRRLTLRQSSDGFHSEYDDSNAIKDGFTEMTNDNDVDDDDDVTNSIITDEEEQNETEQEETFPNDDDDDDDDDDDETNVNTGDLLEEGEGDEEEFDDDDDDFDEDELEESQHEITMQDEDDEEVAEEVTTNSDFVMGDTDEYDDSNAIHEVVDNQNESSKQDDDKQQSYDQFYDDEILEESQDDDDDTTIQTDEDAEENHESDGIPEMDEIQSEEQDIENLTQASVITNTMQEYTDDSDKEIITEESKLKKKKKKSKKKSKKKRKKGKKKKKTKKKSIEKMSTTSNTKPTTTFTELQQPTSTKVRSKSLKQELIKVLLFLAAFILSQITMSFILRMLKSTTNE